MTATYLSSSGGRLGSALGTLACRADRLLLLLAAALAMSFASSSSQAVLAADTPREKPRLVVIVSVDQLCYEYLERFSANFADDGFFRRAAKEGAWYSECHHRHAFTVTAPGHSVMMTGAYPGTSGIIDNTWYDRPNSKTQYCVEDSLYPIVGAAVGKAELKGVSPRNLLVPTLGDVLKQKSNGKAKVFGVTLKDRAAVLMTGRLADAAYWFDPTSGNWVTSTYYRDRLPGYLEQANNSDLAECYAGERWTLRYSREKYRLNHPDDAPFEGDYEKIGRDFPHELLNETNAQYYKQILCTPFGNEMTMRVAEAILVNEKLGQDDVTDVFAVGLSSNDYVGHNFGPHSLEVEDMTYRTDELLGKFLKTLDRVVGPGRWVLALTADHAVAPIPEYSATLGRSAKRNPIGELKVAQTALEAKMVDKFGPLPEGKFHIERLDAHAAYLSIAKKAGAKAEYSAQQKFLRDQMLALPGISIAITRDELLADDTAPLQPKESDASLIGAGLRPLEQFRLSFNAERSGDVLYALRPYCIHGTTPATHGSPWRYDSNVPLLFLGAGIKQLRSTESVAPSQIAPTFAKLLKVDPPSECVEKSLDEVLSND